MIRIALLCAASCTQCNHRTGNDCIGIASIGPVLSRIASLEWPSVRGAVRKGYGVGGATPLGATFGEILCRESHFTAFERDPIPCALETDSNLCISESELLGLTSNAPTEQSLVLPAMWTLLIHVAGPSSLAHFACLSTGHGHCDRNQSKHCPRGTAKKQRKEANLLPLYQLPNRYRQFGLEPGWIMLGAPPFSGTSCGAE
jgi:hypothetical protein